MSPEVPLLESAAALKKSKRSAVLDIPSGSLSKKAKSKSVIKIEPKSMRPLPR